METGNANNTQSAQQKQNQQGFNLSGLDLSAILPPGAWEAIKPFLTGGATAAGVYFFLIKPLQEKIEAQNKIIEQMKGSIDTHKEHISKIELRLNELEKNTRTNEIEKNNNLFETKCRSFPAYPSSISNSTANNRKRNFNL